MGDQGNATLESPLESRFVTRTARKTGRWSAARASLSQYGLMGPFVRQFRSAFDTQGCGDPARALARIMHVFEDAKSLFVVENLCTRFHNNVGSHARVDFGGAKPTKRLERKEPDNDHYRMRLPPGLSANCVCG